MARPLLLLGLLACACGPRTDAPPAAPRLRLWTLPAAVLEQAPHPGARPVFAEDFGPDFAPEDWREVAYPERQAGAFAHAGGSEPERAFRRLSGTQGGLTRRLAVEPDTCYVFSGWLRTNGLESDDGRHGGARFWLGETRSEAPLEELMGSPGELLGASHTFRGQQGSSPWREVRRVFVTRPDTRFLHLVCSLSGADTLRAGSADFGPLRLEASTRATLWHDALARELARRAATDAPAAPWQRARLTSAQLGGEHRPGFVLLPGDRLRFTLPPLPAGAQLTFGLGPWRPALLEPRAARLRVADTDRELLALDVALPAQADEAFWEPHQLALGEPPRLLEFSCEGDTPLVVGAPLVTCAAPRADGPNVLLISIDTLRADHVGAYGAAGGVTPTLDRLARGGILCKDTSAASPYTLPSHTTLLTGQHPSLHGVTDFARVFSAARSRSLAEVLAEAGYATQAFTAGGFVKADFGLDRGFDGFAEIDPIRTRDSHYFRKLERRQGPGRGALAARLLEEHGFAGVERWLREHAAERWFLFLHTYTVHDYDPPERYLTCAAQGCAQPRIPQLRTDSEAQAAAFTPAMRAHVLHLYDAALRYTDERLGELLALLDELGLAANTLVVVTSDHGEEFFERGHLQHGRTLYEELLRIPLILHGPGLAPRVLARPAMLVDVAPTLLARLGLAPLLHAQGVDLLGPSWPARPIWAEVEDPFAHKYALREESGRKTLHGPPSAGLKFPNTRLWEQYDLGRDPREQDPLTSEQDAELAAARAMLTRYRAALLELGARLGAVGEGRAEESTLEELEGLGYGGLTEK